MFFLSDHFERSEFACQCGCGFCAVDVELLFVLEQTRRHFNDRPLHINSGCRCADHNGAIGGSNGSMHTKGMAVDFFIKGVDAAKVADYLEKTFPDTYGIGRYPGRTHLDVREQKARWSENH
jgi:uncharacterized protein YcbK (DUF882 family)